MFSFNYKNWKGIEGKRRVIPLLPVYTSTKYHLEKQWLLIAFDLDKRAIRTFAIKDIEERKKERS